MKLLEFFLTLGFILALFGTSSGQSRLDSQSVFVKGCGYKGYVLGSLALEDMAFGPLNDYNQPTKSDISKIEKIVDSFFKQCDKILYANYVQFPLKNYYRQYYGYTNPSNGTKIISVNFIHSKNFKSRKERSKVLKQDYLEIADGSRIRFSMRINLKTGEILYMNANSRGGQVYPEE